MNYILLGNFHLIFDIKSPITMVDVQSINYQEFIQFVRVIHI